jgi:SsrA-binding protein
MSQQAKGRGHKRLIASNRRARHEYTVDDTYEAGLVLTGTEVKSLRQGNAVITDGFLVIKDGEAWLHQIHIPVYSHGNRENHEPVRKRKLLMRLREIAKLEQKLSKQGYTAFPLELYFKGPWVKVSIGLGKGKKLYDKRQTEKERSARRELRERY